MELSIDVETWATSNDAALFQIGAVAFDFNDTLECHEHLQRDTLVFSGTIEPFVEYAGVKYSAETQAWWHHADQAHALSSVLEMPDRGSAKEILEKFAAWVPRNLGKRARVWAKPPGFDLKILRHNFEVFGIKCPWDHRQEACVRTITWAAQHVLGVEFRVPSIDGAGLIKHNALHDAAQQATVTQAALRALILHERKWGPGKKTLKE